MTSTENPAADIDELHASVERIAQSYRAFKNMWCEADFGTDVTKVELMSELFRFHFHCEKGNNIAHFTQLMPSQMEEEDETMLPTSFRWYLKDEHASSSVSATHPERDPSSSPPVLTWYCERRDHIVPLWREIRAEFGKAVQIARKAVASTLEAAPGEVILYVRGLECCLKPSIVPCEIFDFPVVNPIYEADPAVVFRLVLRQNGGILFDIDTSRRCIYVEAAAWDMASLGRILECVARFRLSGRYTLAKNKPYNEPLNWDVTDSSGANLWCSGPGWVDFSTPPEQGIERMADVKHLLSQ
jgi:hypothetical protein